MFSALLEPKLSRHSFGHVSGHKHVKHVQGHNKIKIAFLYVGQLDPRNLEITV